LTSCKTVSFSRKTLHHGVSIYIYIYIYIRINISLRLSFVVARIRNKILLRFAYYTSGDVVFFINVPSLNSVGNCRTRYSFCNILNNQIRNSYTVCSANIVVFWYVGVSYLHGGGGGGGAMFTCGELSCD